jgi:hypothetical protein
MLQVYSSGVGFRRIETATKTVSMASAVGTQYNITTAQSFDPAKTIVLVQVAAYPASSSSQTGWCAKANQVAPNTCRLEVIMLSYGGIAVTADLRVLIIELAGVKSVQHVQDSIVTGASPGATKDTTIIAVNPSRAVWFKGGYEFYSDNGGRSSQISGRILDATTFRAEVVQSTYSRTNTYCFWVVDPR